MKDLKYCQFKFIIIFLTLRCESKLSILLQIFKKRYSGICLIIFVEHCGTKKGRLFLELKAGILKFIFLRSLDRIVYH